MLTLFILSIKGVVLLSEKVQKEHKPISIELEIGEKMQRFVTPNRINGTLLRQAALISEDFESEVSGVADLDSYYQFVSDVFGGQFNLQEFEEGADSRDLLKIVNACTYFVMGQVSIAAEMLISNVDIGELNEKKTYQKQ